MAPGNDENTCLRIVQTRAGQGTGETFYKTSDGRWWRDAQWWEQQGTQVADIRYMHRSHLCTHK